MVHIAGRCFETEQASNGSPVSFGIELAFLKENEEPGNLDVEKQGSLRRLRISVGTELFQIESRAKRRKQVDPVEKFCMDESARFLRILLPSPRGVSDW